MGRIGGAAVAVAVSLAACGRVGFDDHADARAGAHDSARAIDAARRPADGSGAGSATVAVVQIVCGAPGPGSNAFTLAVTAAAAADDLGVIAFEDDPPTALDSLTDDGSANWMKLGETQGNAGEVLYATPIPQATTTITLQVASEQDCACYYEVSGIDLSNPVDDADAGGGTATAGTLPGARVVTTAASDFVVAVADSAEDVEGIDPGNDFTEDSALETDGHAHLVTTASGIYQPVWDVPGGTYSTYSAAFRGR
nr:hypothetical protein [Kofleriaceae bacterium]